MKFSRRDFLSMSAGVLGGVLAGCRFNHRTPGRSFGGGIMGASSKVGHLLREGGIPAPSETDHIGIAIVGGGIAGLSAARKLKRSGCEDFCILELEEKVGGNSTSGRNPISAYPWGAHYIPLPAAENCEILKLFEELGIITGYDTAGLPIYNEFYLCADPHERLYLHGQWQEGLVPQVGASANDQAQYGDFFPTMEAFKSAKGRDGKPAFNIPIDSSSRDPDLLKLDRISMEQYMDERKWTSEYLRWYVNYCCRDDYGAEMRDVSAWAGLHYFASRSGKASNAGNQSVVTWPEGNGWIVNRFREEVGSHARPTALAVNIEQTSGNVFVDYFDVARARTVRLFAGAVIFAAPRFVAGKVLRDFRQNPQTFASFTYSPWMVANITLRSLPQGKGAPLSWDNVIYPSESLGYVVATHQNVDSHPLQTVLTYYWPLSSKDPHAARSEAVATSYDVWVDRIVRDLSRVHPGIEKEITHLDVWLWGHGMIRPTPGFIWGPAREEALKPRGHVFFAHSDMSGISIFEEAYGRGIQAAEKAMDHIHWKRTRA